jgi:hypothetical protein
MSRVKLVAAKFRERLADERANARVRFRPGPAIKIVEAILMALLAGVLFALIAEPVGFVAFFISLIVFLVLMLHSEADRVHFRFGVVFGIECLLLPIMISVAPHETDSSIWGMDTGLWLVLSIPLGVVMGLSSLFIAVFFFRD